MTYSAITGLLVAHQTWEYKVVACRSCSDEIFRTARRKLAFTGWWSVTGLFITPLMLIGNAVGRRRHRRRLDEPIILGFDPAQERERFFRRTGVQLTALIVLMVVLLAIARLAS
ncbi:MAG TPA: hypothetical protein VGC11_07725 [Acidimicrobiia bacterium]